MNIALLIDAVVRQTTVLIAQLATSGGVRAPLAHVANQVFLDLAHELETQGVSRKVSADMFGMALRAYVRKVQRLGESATVRGRSLWEAVYDFLSSRDVVQRSAVIERFFRDDEALVRGVLHDLTESGLVFCSGFGPNAVFRIATESELGAIGQFTSAKVEEMLWVIIYREGPFTRSQLQRRVALKPPELERALESLVADGRIQRKAATGDTEEQFSTASFVVGMGAERGWEAALLDHYHALVRTICQKLQSPEATENDVVGGSTYTFAVWEGHPLRDEVLGALRGFRQRHSELRARVSAYNKSQGVPETYEQVIVYGGQSVTPEELPRP